MRKPNGAQSDRLERAALRQQPAAAPGGARTAGKRAAGGAGSMAGVDDEASEGALAEEATIVLFRNPETTGFGALCQRIAASTTLEVCFSPQPAPARPRPARSG